MTWYCANVAGDDHEFTLFGPAKDFGVINGQRKVGVIPNENDFERQSTPHVRSLACRPERPSQVFV
jgi:hypothetical protein